MVHMVRVMHDVVDVVMTMVMMSRDRGGLCGERQGEGGDHSKQGKDTHLGSVLGTRR